MCDNFATESGKVGFGWGCSSLLHTCVPVPPGLPSVVVSVRPVDPVLEAEAAGSPGGGTEPACPPDDGVRSRGLVLALPSGLLLVPGLCGRCEPVGVSPLFPCGPLVLDGGLLCLLPVWGGGEFLSLECVNVPPVCGGRLVRALSSVVYVGGGSLSLVCLSVRGDARGGGEYPSLGYVFVRGGGESLSVRCVLVRGGGEGLLLWRVFPRGGGEFLPV